MFNNLLIIELPFAMFACKHCGKPMSPHGSVKPKRVALYLRVSTNEQSTRNQRRELCGVAARHGWNVVATYEGR